MKKVSSVSNVYKKYSMGFILSNVNEIQTYYQYGKAFHI